MSKSPTIGGTITGGIQDISALLPLLGTEQCERHVGSALDAGFLYSAVTPISIFGSLGMVRASFNILVASFNIQRYQVLGARLLSNGGFKPSGTVAPMIALDPKHPKRFLAETMLEAMLAEEHIDNVDNLTVSWGKGIVRWNLMLVAFTLVISSAGLLPYIIIILDSGDLRRTPLFPLGFGFPILRVFGSAVCVIVAQLLIQIRIVAIMKNRLLFITINRLAKLNNIEDLTSEISVGLQEENTNNAWASALAAEKCLWTLQKWLATSTDPERAENHRKMVDIYATQYELHFGLINFPIRPWMTLLLCFGLAIGCISTVVGYIGSFFLIQHSMNPNGPLVWLVLEAVLSVLRILLWAINPSWDDSKGIDFELQLCNPPVLTVNTTVEEILDPLRLTYLTRNIVNLEEAVAYAGPIPIFSVQDVEFYYIFAINSRSEDTSRRLLIVISIPKEQRSRILFKEALYSPFSIYICTLQSFKGNTLTALTVDGLAQRDSHFLTLHSVFMAELEAHYDKINFQLQNQGYTEERRAIFGKTWAMQRPLTEPANYDQHPETEKTGPPLLTADEKSYLNQYLVEQRRSDFFFAVEECTSTRINVYSRCLGLTPDTMSTPVGMNEMFSFLWWHEVFEKTCILIECQLYFERSLKCMSAKWDKDVRKTHANMVEIILKALFEKATKSPPSVGSIGRKRHDNNIRQYKLEARLSGGLEQYLQALAKEEGARLRDRLSDHLTPLVYEGARVEHQPELVRQMSRIPELCLNRVGSLIRDADLADLFKLPSDLAAGFNASSTSEQCSMLVEIQKNDFLREMEDRFRDYPRRDIRGRFLLVDGDSDEENFDLDDEAKGMIDRSRAKCRARSDKLFEMLASSATIDFKRIIDSPGLSGPLNVADKQSDLTQFTRILEEVSEEWERKVKQSEEELAKMEKRVVQTKISDYFVKKL